MNINYITPRQFNDAASGMKIGYGFCTTPFAAGMISWNKEDICFLGFELEGRQALKDDMTARWKGASFEKDDARAQRLSDMIFDRSCKGHDNLSLLLKGTPFQIEVWKALLEIPFGQTTSYSRIASAVGRPLAVRAAASAVGRNDISYLIPCHRVLRSDNSLGGYYWGLPVKKAILEWENS